MGDLLVKGADVHDGRITRLRVAIERLPERVIDRALALRLLADGHSLIPFDGHRMAALQRVVVGEDEAFIRNDNEPVSADAVPPLPPAG